MKRNNLLLFLVPFMGMSITSCNRDTVSIYPMVSDMKGTVACNQDIQNEQLTQLFIELNEDEEPLDIQCHTTVHYMLDNMEVASSMDTIVEDNKYFRSQFTPHKLSVGKHILTAVVDVDCDKHQHIINFRVFPKTFEIQE